jgi:hypothetical protein
LKKRILRAPTSGKNTRNKSTRTHNAANEISSISTAYGTTWAAAAHDPAGNMITCPKPGDEATHLHLVYDAWNRLAKAEDVSCHAMQGKFRGRFCERLRACVLSAP